MKTWESRLQHTANALAILTGTLFGCFKYFPSEPFDAYSPAMSPWEPWSHDAHVLAVPVLVYACGVIWRSHVAPQWRGRKSPKLQACKKWSGLGLLCVLLPMVATGYLIQVSVNEIWRKTWVIVHLLTSGAWTLSYVLHFLAPARRPLFNGKLT